MKHKTAKANVKTRTRLLSLLLAVLMTLFCFPVTALGTDGIEGPISETLEETADAGLSAFERGVGELSPEALESMTLNAADVPEVISAQAIAEKNHVLRLREQEENLNTVVFQNRDGGKTVYLYANPVKYVDANGNVKDKSTALKAENITLNGKTYSHSATENVFGQYYPTMPQNGVLITFGQYTVEMTPVITGILTLRDTAVANNKVTYNKVFGNGTSLVYTPTLSGVKEDIILQTYTGKSSFSFTLKTNGLAIVQTENDTFLADFEGNKVASLGKVIITDRANHTAYGSMTVAAKTEREEYTVTINAPTAFLTSATTVYPVTVDPTLVINEEFMYDADYGEQAIEDLCVYDGTEDPIYDDIATVGPYAEGNTSAIHYRVTQSAWDLLGIGYYIDSGRFNSVTLNISVFGLTTGLNVITTPSLSSWPDGTSQSVDWMYFQDYYADANSDITSLTSSSNHGVAQINVTNVFEYMAANPTAVSTGFLMYVDTNTATQDFFSVYQVEESDTDVYFTIDYDVLEGDYYINSKTTGQFLSILNATSVDQSIYNTSKEQAWKLTFLGNDNYTISRTLQPNRVLVMDDSGNVFIGSKTTYDADNYTWHFTFYAGTVTLYNVGAGKYLHANSNGSITSSTSSTDARWRLCETSEFVPLESITVADIVMEVGETATPTITPEPANATWVSASDFDWIHGNTNVFSISSLGTITASNKGNINIILSSKTTTNVSGSFKVNVYSGKVIFSIFSFDDSDSHSDFDSGHSFVGIYNDTSKDIEFFNKVIEKDERITLGTWSSENNERTGVWINQELYQAQSISAYARRRSLSAEFASQSAIDGMINKVKTYITENDSWSITNNCSSFASGIWNFVTNDNLSAGTINTPRELKKSIESRSSYKVNALMGTYIYTAYFNSANNNFSVVSYD